MPPYTWLRRALGSPARADLLLFGLPAVFLGTYLLGIRVLASETLPVVVAGVVCAALIADALFRRPPDGTGTGPRDE